MVMKPRLNYKCPSNPMVHGSSIIQTHIIALSLSKFIAYIGSIWKQL